MVIKKETYIKENILGRRLCFPDIAKNMVANNTYEIKDEKTSDNDFILLVFVFDIPAKVQDDTTNKRNYLEI